MRTFTMATTPESPCGTPLSAAMVTADQRDCAWTTILGFGSLLSQRSAQCTCPNLRNFQLARVKHFRRVFAHPAAVFFERGIARPETLEVSSLSTEPCAGATFVVAAFEVPRAEVPGLLAREEEFDFVRIPFFDLATDAPLGTGFMCTRSTDEEAFGARGLRPKYEALLGPHFPTVSIWSWGPDSGILPCPVYCRHCVLAASAPTVPKVATDSFLDETFLADRTTSLRDHLANHPHVMECEPPESLKERYSG